MKKRTQTAFTLAEVLIALTIIGVVSALTIPTLVQKTNKQEYVSALQKAYSTLSQATQQIIAENGSPKGEEGWAKDADSVYKNFKKYLINAKDCDGNSGCFPAGTRYKFLGGSPDSIYDDYSSTNYKRLVLSDGVSIMFHGANPNCTSGGYEGDITKKDVCAVILADINGAKKPNVIGRDAFWFLLRENGLHPAGCYKDSPDCHAGTGRTGDTCACKVLREGRMDY